ncbi:MAG: hypothetical protein EBZ77_01025 [Chitinophagia bacterium]|nr:hypothetical protein [Chitinophagia bacterium]
MKNNNQNNNRSRSICCDDDLPGIITSQQGEEKDTLAGILKGISCVSGADLIGAFSKAAEMLIRNSVLIAGQSQYQIKEIEFYFSSEEHKDPYVHSVQYSNVHRQSEFGEWYFHRYLTRENYNHNRRGLDLTIGDKEKNTSGGILVRGLKPLAGGKPIQGPSKVVNEILTQLDNFKSDYSIDDLAKGTGTFVFNTNSPLSIMPFEHPTSKLLNSKRLGLAPKSEDMDGNFRNALYRYFDDDYLTSIKGKEGIFRELVERGIYKQQDAKQIIGYDIK